MLDDIVTRRASLRAIALMRALFGAIVIRHLWPDMTAAVTPVERFHVPWWPWLPIPSPTTYELLALLGVTAGAAMLAGVATRLATATAFGVVAYLQFVDMTSFAHNRAFLIWALFGLSLLPTGRAFTLPALVKSWARRRRGDDPPAPAELIGPVWPVFMLQVVMSSVYLTSGGTKLLNPDWRSGIVLHDRMLRHEHLIPFDGWVYDILTSRAFHYVLSPTAIAIELIIATGLWFRHTRWAAAGLAVIFHLSIELTASVQTFSYSAIAALLIWAVPTTARRQADPEDQPPRWLRALIR